MKVKQEKNNRRIPLSTHQTITIKDTKIICDTCIGEGSSCLVYRGHIANENTMIPGTQVIIKEFYPILKSDQFKVFREETTGKLQVSADTENESIKTKYVLQNLKNYIVSSDHEKVQYKFDEYKLDETITELEHRFIQFLQGLWNQKRLSRSEAMEIAVKPWIEGWWGESYYVISDIHRGIDLSKAALDTLEKKFLAAIGIAEMLDILHESGFLLLDLKPENLMWIEYPSMIRIMDVDSLIRFDEIEEDWKILFSNFQYASPEIEVLNWKMQEGLSADALKKVKKDYLQKDSNFYSFGIYLWELFFDEAFLKSDLQTNHRNDRIQHFAEKYAIDNLYEETKLLRVGNALMDVLGKLLIENRTRRRKEGYGSAESIMKELNEIYTMLTSKKYLFRKEISKANGTFSAYHLLQKYPLFQYRTVDRTDLRHQIRIPQTKLNELSLNERIHFDENLHRLEVFLIGKHAMRKDMLSAVISIGQMLDTHLHIYLIASDAAAFWDNYLSEANNPGLRDAVIWTLDEAVVSDTCNSFLVDRPLAQIHLVTKDTASAIDTLTKKKTGRYFIILEENTTKKMEVCQFLFDMVKEQPKNERYLISCLQTQEESIWNSEFAARNHLQESAVYEYFVPISVDSFSEIYNEKMYENQIYNMGLMAYAYYNGLMKDEEEKQKEDTVTEYEDVDMKELEHSFRQDIYGIASSERCALHSIYKIASLGIPRNKPGRFLNFYRKLQNPEILEKLSWLEHLSWTAYLLTSGAVPVFTKAEDLTKENFKQLFESYAYLEKNDWKDKRIPGHMRHPFLVAYGLNGYKKTGKGWLDRETELSKEAFECLDPLDQVSYRLNEWYREKIQEIRNTITRSEDTKSDTETHETTARWQQYEKILSDAQKEHDIKQADRDLVFAAVDMIV